jgi:flagellar hook-basal body complex protein FliE
MSDLTIRGRIAPPLSAAVRTASDAKKAASGNFGELLKGMIAGAESLQQEANKEITKVHQEQSSSIHEVMIAMEKADISFRTMMLMRNKLLEAYQEVMRLQV